MLKNQKATLRGTCSVERKNGKFGGSKGRGGKGLPTISQRGGGKKKKRKKALFLEGTAHEESQAKKRPGSEQVSGKGKEPERRTPHKEEMQLSEFLAKRGKPNEKSN